MPRLMTYCHPNRPKRQGLGCRNNASVSCFTFTLWRTKSFCCADRHLTTLCSTVVPLTVQHREKEPNPSIATVSVLPRKGPRDSETRRDLVGTLAAPRFERKVSNDA